MRRLAVLGLAAASVAAVLVAPAPSGPDRPDVVRPVSNAVLACPELAVTEDTVHTLAGLVAPGGGATTAGRGSASLRVIDGELDVARLPGVGQPVDLVVAGRSQPPYLLLASQTWAPEAVAGVAGFEVEGAGAGLVSAACPPPGPLWWFVGTGSELGRGSALLVSNPAQEPARVDITLHARSGPVAALAGKGINLGPQSHVRLRLDALAQDEDLLAVQVRSTSGRVVAALRDVAVPRGVQPRGVDYIPPAIAPTTRLWIPGIPDAPAQRDLVLVNPGTQFATVRTRLLTEGGPTPLAGLATIAVPAGSVITTSLDRVMPRTSGTLELVSDVPVTGGVRAAWGSQRRDVAWLSAVPPVARPTSMAAAAAVPAAPGLVTTVTVAAPDGAVTGTLLVLTTGTAEGSVFTPEGVAEAERAAQRRAQEEQRAAEEADGRDAEDAADAGRDGPEPTRIPSGVALLAGDVATAPAVPVSVPAGSQRTIEVPVPRGASLAHLVWRSDPGTGPAVVSHLVVNNDAVSATGYSWWPTVSAVRATAVREDAGVLAPAP